MMTIPASPNPRLHRWALKAFLMGCLALVAVAASGAAQAAEPGSGPGSALPVSMVIAMFAGLAAFGLFAWRRRAADEPHAMPQKLQSTPRRTAPQARSVPAPMAFAAAPQLEAIEWDGGLPAARPAAPPRVVPAPKAGVSKLPDTQRHRILERYLGARFTGVASRIEDLMASAAVVKSARLLFEDGQTDRALELLAIASDANPSDETTTLARLELLYLERNGAGYRRAANAFASRHPQSAQWPEIRELARNLGLVDALFVDLGVRENSFPQYGPWPGLPNWIQAPWDLTAEVTAAELHSRMRARFQARAAQPARRAA